MYVIHSHLTFSPDVGDAFERQSLASRDGDRIADAPGFVRRIMLRDDDHLGEFFYISLWETPEQHHAYQAERLRQFEEEAAVREAAGEPAPTPVMVRCQTTLLFEDTPTGQTAAN